MSTYEKDLAIIEATEYKYDGTWPYSEGRMQAMREFHDHFNPVKVRELVEENQLLLKTFGHYHVNNGVDDACKQCGLDIRNPVHKRG